MNQYSSEPLLNFMYFHTVCVCTGTVVVGICTRITFKQTNSLLITPLSDMSAHSIVNSLGTSEEQRELFLFKFRDVDRTECYNLEKVCLLMF